MNLLKQFRSLLPQDSLGVATLEIERSPNYWRARSEAGVILFLTGEGKQGDKVFFDHHTMRIREKAPKIDFTDVPL